MTTDKAMVTDAKAKLKLWFFRDLSGEQRGKLLSLFGMNDAQKDTSHGYQGSALSQVVRALTLERGEAEPVLRVRHKKRGSEYEVIGTGKMQSEHWWERNPDRTQATFGQCDQLIDGREVTVYRSIDDGQMWVRPREEFEDGRFETSTISKRGEAEETPAKVQHLVGPDRATVGRHMKDFEEFVARTAPKLHWTVHQDGCADPSRHNGYFDGWQHGFGEALFGPLPLDRLMEEMKSSLKTKVATTEGRADA